MIWNLISHLSSLVLLNCLSSEPLVKDVHHLAAQVDEEEGQSPLGHDEDPGGHLCTSALGNGGRGGCF